MLKLWILICFIEAVYDLPSKTRKYGFVRGDLMIGALFPIHEQPTLNGSYTRECGEIREEYGMHRVEVLLKTIREINANPKILDGLTLGVDIRDSCWYAPIALEQSIDFIKNSLSFQVNQERNASKPIVGLIGPAASEVTVQVQNLLQLFKIPQIGYSATSIDLSSKNSYKYFMRVVPSDTLQVKALIDLLNYFKWSYISLLNSKGSYGEEGIKELQEHLKNKTDICTDQELEIDNKEEAPKFELLATNLFKKGKAKVILCFCQGDTVTKLLRAMTKLNMTKKGYLIIGTDGWADRTDILGTMRNGGMELSEAAMGSITIRLHSKPIPDFDDYFRSKTSVNTPGNPWFQEFWEKKFSCHFNITKSNKYQKVCSRNESLFNMPYVQDSKLGFVVKSVMTVALGLNKIYQKICVQKKLTLQKCLSVIYLNGTVLLEEMINLKFNAYDNETVRFDSKGDPPGTYDIMNYQYWYNNKTGKFEFHYKKIGSWKENDLVIEDHLIQWPKSEVNYQNNQTGIKSDCSAPCKFDEIRDFSEGKKCCWTCKQCLQHEIINKTFHSESCNPCLKGFLPNDNRSTCNEIPAFFNKWSDASVIVAIIFSIVGLIITVIITGIFVKYNDTPVVKSSTRELMYVILAGIALSYLTTFPLVWKPTTFSCLLSRIMPGLSFSFIFGSLVTKTNRICRILSISKKKIIRRKGRFLTTTAQIVIVFLLNVVEAIIISVMIWQQPPNPMRIYPDLSTARLVCNTNPSSLFISMGFDAVLICFCTWYAFKTRNLPENFNEAKFIGFTMYTTCIIWIGFVVIYLSTALREIPLCFAMHLTATICIVFLFLPKLYIILFKPERNERSAFTTTTEIRCHIGSGKTDNDCSKNKSDRRKSNANHLFLVDDRKSSIFRSQTEDCLLDQISTRENGLLAPSKHKESKFIQTEFSLIMEFLLNLCSSFHCENDDLTISQIALLQFLKDNWNKDHIPQLQKLNFCDRHSIELTGSDVKFMDEDHILDNLLDETDIDNSSLKHPLNKQCNSVLTCSPISNASTNDSSTITSLFLEYLQMHGKQFKNMNDIRSVKL